jgi:hypothetical protein
MTALQGMRKAALALLVAVAGATAVARADSFYQDPNTGLLWSESLTQLTDSWWTWDQAMSLAANYTGGGYSDWRLPTRVELLTAASNGTLHTILQFGAANYPIVPPGYARFWTSERKGNKAYALEVFFDNQGTLLSWQMVLLEVRPGGWAIDAFMVRGRSR